MNIDPTRQYNQGDLPADIFNSTNGDIKNFNGQQVRVGVNQNGTRSLTPMGGTGTSGTNLGNVGGDISSFLSNSKQGLTDLLNQGNQQESDFITNFKNAIPGIVQGANQQFGVPDLNNVTSALRTRISQLTDNTTGAGAGGYASGDQVDQAVNQNYLPQYNTAMTNLQSAEQLANQNVNQQLLPFQTQAQMISDQLAREMTGYTSEQQNELSGLLGQLQAGIQLNEGQLNRANQLAIAEQGYQNALQIAQTQNQYREIPYLGGLFNTASGQMVGGGGGGGGLSFDTSAFSGNTLGNGSSSLPGLNQPGGPVGPAGPPPSFFTPDKSNLQSGMNFFG